MYDANSTLQASTTQTGSFTSTSISLRNPATTASVNIGGTPRELALDAQIVVTAISGTPTSVTFSLQHSDDNSTWYTIASQLDAPFSASTGVTYIAFETDKPYVRLVETMVGGTTPSITYFARLGISRP